MAIKTEDAFDLILALLKNDKTIKENMEELISLCESILPHDDWKKLKVLNYNDLSNVNDWLRIVFSYAPPSTKIAGLWFGIYESYYDDSLPTTDIAVSGSSRFEENSNQWACGAEYIPEMRQNANSEILRFVHRIAYSKDNPLGINALYPLALGYGCFLIKELMNQLEPNMIKIENEIGVVVGFNDGDYIILGKYKNNILNIEPK